MQVAFRSRASTSLGIGGVAQQEQHALVSELPEPLHVCGQAVGGRFVQLEIAGVDHAPDGSFDGECHRIRDGVADGHSLDAERAQLNSVPHSHLAQVGLA